ncbi:hypothetical protein HZA75_07450 [Candidatus Roizmanbacteria bacterium]|nr:hypothetical protein [Candidatus Roizmanbacteria bacterium]
MISLGIIVIICSITYWAEKANYFFYNSKPLFTSVKEFITWAGVFILSGFNKGAFPKSLVGILSICSLPLVLLGSVVAIYRMTSVEGHEILIEKLAHGKLPSDRILFFNYQSKFSELVKEILENSKRFIILFCSDKELISANELKNSLNENPSLAYRIYVAPASLEQETLADRFNIYNSYEIYFFSDLSEQTDYHNMQFLMDILHDSNKINIANTKFPHIFFETNDVTVKSILKNIQNPVIRQRIHLIFLYHDYAEYLMANTDGSLKMLNRYYKLNGESDDHHIFSNGDLLRLYRFCSYKLADESLKRLQSLKELRIQTNDLSDNTEQKMEDYKKVILSEIESQFISNGKILYGLLAKTGKNLVQMDLVSAFNSQQIETASSAICLENNFSSENKSTLLNSFLGKRYVINLNEDAIEFLDKLSGENFIENDKKKKGVIVFSTDYKYLNRLNDEFTVIKTDDPYLIVNKLLPNEATSE